MDDVVSFFIFLFFSPIDYAKHFSASAFLVSAFKLKLLDNIKIKVSNNASDDFFLFNLPAVRYFAVLEIMNVVIFNLVSLWKWRGRDAPCIYSLAAYAQYSLFNSCKRQNVFFSVFSGWKSVKHYLAFVSPFSSTWWDRSKLSLKFASFESEVLSSLINTW